MFLGAKLELPIALVGGEVGLTDKCAALVFVLQVDGEVRNLPQGLDTLAVEHHLRVLDAETGEVGCVAAAGPLEDIGDSPRYIELTAGACRNRRLRAFGDCALRRRAGPRFRGGKRTRLGRA